MGMRRLSCTISASNRKKIRTLGLLVVVGGSIGAAKNWNLALLPSLHHRKEGCLRHQENFAKPPKLTQTGWFSFCSHRKTTPSSRSADASRYFLDRSATPPCGDARRGVAPTVAQRHFFIAPM